jgi:hypothetical protein
MPENTICPWIDDTLQLLSKLPRNVQAKDVAAAAGVPVSWLSKFQAGKFKAPNIYYIYRLHKYLTQTANV